MVLVVVMVFEVLVVVLKAFFGGCSGIRSRS